MEERQYRYEMHLHTAEGSRCADRTVEEQLTLYRDLGYAGVCLTDHDILSLCRDTTTHPEWLFFVDHPLYTKPTQT